jgi:hypothetical protein
MKQKILDFLIAFFLRFIPSVNTNVPAGNVGIVTLLCHRDVHRYIYAINSLFYYLGNPLPLYVVDDGTLTKADIALLHRYFTVRIEEAASASRKIAKVLAPYQPLFDFRFSETTGVFKKKLDAYFLSPFRRYIYLDSDILFFREPGEINRWLTKNTDTVLYTLRREDITTNANREAVITQYAFRKLLYRSINSKTHPLFIAGFLCIPDKRVLSPETLNKSIRILYRYSYERAALAEETAVAMSLDQKLVRYLPIDTYVNINCRKEYAWAHSLQNKVFIHYSGIMKIVWFEVDALILLWRTRFFVRY